jgi:hypothetical protein
VVAQERLQNRRVTGVTAPDFTLWRGPAVTAPDFTLWRGPAGILRKLGMRDGCQVRAVGSDNETVRRARITLCNVAGAERCLLTRGTRACGAA